MQLNLDQKYNVTTRKGCLLSIGSIAHMLQQTQDLSTLLEDWPQNPSMPGEDLNNLIYLRRPLQQIYSQDHSTGALLSYPFNSHLVVRPLLLRPQQLFEAQIVLLNFQKGCTMRVYFYLQLAPCHCWCQPRISSMEGGRIWACHASCYKA